MRTLTQGQLTPKIVSVRQINRLLNAADEELLSNGYRLCTQTAKAVYGSRNFDVVRSKNTLYIRLRLPYTSLYVMNIFRTTTFPLPVPGRQGLVTELKGFSKYIITDDDGSLMTIGELLQAPRGDVIDPSDILWHKANSRSCVFDLMSDTLNATTDVCQFSMQKETIKPHYMQLLPGMYLLFNVWNI